MLNCGAFEFDHFGRKEGGSFLFGVCWGRMGMVPSIFCWGYNPVNILMEAALQTLLYLSMSGRHESTE